jgi:hypothetical protein
MRKFLRRLLLWLERQNRDFIYYMLIRLTHTTAETY